MLGFVKRGSLAVGVALYIGLSGAAIGACEQTTQAPTATASVVVHADAEWYKSRVEPEGRWQGVLERQTPPLGPGARTALRFRLKTANGDLAIYSAGADQALAPLTGQRVEVVGKLVDLRSEGFATELWIATISPLSPRN